MYYFIVGVSNSVLVVESGSQTRTEFAEQNARVTIDPWEIWQRGTLLALGVKCGYQGEAQKEEDVRVKEQTCESHVSRGRSFIPEWALREKDYYGIACGRRA